MTDEDIGRFIRENIPQDTAADTGNDADKGGEEIVLREDGKRLRRADRREDTQTDAVRDTHDNDVIKQESTDRADTDGHTDAERCKGARRIDEHGGRHLVEQQVADDTTADCRRNAEDENA